METGNNPEKKVRVPYEAPPPALVLHPSSVDSGKEELNLYPWFMFILGFIAGVLVYGCK